MPTTLPLRSIEAETPLQGRHPLGAAILGGSAGIAAGMLAGAMGLMTVGMAMMIVLSVGVAIMYAGSRYATALQRQELAYRERIAKIDAAELARLSASPELDERSRGIIVKHLNASRPGWSMAAN